MMTTMVQMAAVGLEKPNFPQLKKDAEIQACSIAHSLIDCWESERSMATALSTLICFYRRSCQTLNFDGVAASKRGYCCLMQITIAVGRITNAIAAASLRNSREGFVITIRAIAAAIGFADTHDRRDCGNFSC